MYNAYLFRNNNRYLRQLAESSCQLKFHLFAKLTCSCETSKISHMRMPPQKEEFNYLLFPFKNDSESNFVASNPKYIF
jgi:hypothetical protein